MEAADRAEFARMLTDALAFYRQDVSKFALSVWWEACKPFDMEQVSKALTAHALDPERGQFAPKPADMIRVLRGTQTDRALVAWGKVYEAIGAAGAYQSVVFDDPLIHAAIVDLGGWTTVCRSPGDELPHLQRRFCDSYRAYARRPDVVYPPKLIGESEAANAHLGRAVAAPLLLGNREAALQVFRSGSESGRLPMVAMDALPAMQQIGRAA
jgi:hypothetical protein